MGFDFDPRIMVHSESAAPNGRASTHGAMDRRIEPLWWTN